MKKKKNKKSTPSNQKLFISVSIVATLLIIASCGLLIHKGASDNSINNDRVEQLKETDQDVQIFGNLLEQDFPGLIIRKKYCKHTNDKFGYGPLFCTTSIKIKTNYTSEENLVTAINTLNSIISEQSSFTYDEVLPTQDISPRASSHIFLNVEDKRTLMNCSSATTVVHFYSQYPDDYGDFEFYLSCSTDPLKKPIYKIEDIH